MLDPFKTNKQTNVVNDSPPATWRLLMVSPPFPMTSPALEAGIMISCTVIPGPSLGLNAGAGRPFSTISVKSLFAVLKKSNADHTVTPEGVNKCGIKATYWIDSGSPVNVTDLSGMPPLSTRTEKTKQYLLSLQYQYPICKYYCQEDLPGAICILQPDSCCNRDICSPPLPITLGGRGKKKLI